MKKRKSKIKCLLFDYGGVLTSGSIDPVHDALNRKLGKRVFVRKASLHSQILKGWIKSRDYYMAIAEKTGKSQKYIGELFLSTYTRLIKLNKRTLSLAKNAKRNGYKIGILSNITSVVKGVNEKRGLFKEFSPVILSCDVGCMKPQKKMYRIAINKSGLRPEEIVYIDDRKELLLPAKRLGMKTLHFRNASQLRQDLKKVGVKI
ncbi:MAG: HAD family phosphatase [Candidatus Aenigmarchaeota archaeon]|nr:HAD family phosphatase [Candidatus Aenigmarchaeota archaeon]